MALLPNYLLKRYLSVSFSVAIGASIALLLLRLDDIAHIASLGADPKDILFFTIYQIPYLLPIILPIAAMLAAFLLFREMRDKHQLTSLRSSGVSLRRILTPVALAALVLSFVNFALLSEISTNAHLQTHLLKKRLRSVNPLQLVHNKKILRLHGAFFETLGPHQVGRFANRAVFALPHETGTRLFLGSRLDYRDGRLDATGVSLLFSGKKGSFRGVENAQNLRFEAGDFSSFFKEKAWKIENDHLSLSGLLKAIQETPLAKKKSALISEIIRRFFLAFLVLQFSLLGATACLSQGRRVSKTGVILLFLNVLYFLFVYFFGETLYHQWPLYLALTSSSYFFMTATSLFCYRSYEKGRVL